MISQSFEEPLYKTVGKAVGGYIEIVRPVNLEDPFVMIVNEEGKIEGLPENLFGSWLYGKQEHGEPIVGNIVIMKEGIVDDEPDIVGLDPKEATALMMQIPQICHELERR